MFFFASYSRIIPVWNSLPETAAMTPIQFLKMRIQRNPLFVFRFTHSDALRFFFQNIFMDNIQRMPQDALHLES